MKNLLRFLGIIALVAVTGFAMVSCGGGGGGGGTPTTKISSTSGGLTITGLSAYNGKYVTAISTSHGLQAAGNISSSAAITGALISNGEATLKVWTITETGFGNYNGNDQSVVFLATILDSTTLSPDPNASITVGSVTASFTNGTGSGAFIVF